MDAFDIWETRETINDLGYRYKFQPLDDCDSFLLITYHNGEIINQKDMGFSFYLKDDVIAEISFEVACNHWLESVMK